MAVAEGSRHRNDRVPELAPCPGGRGMLSVDGLAFGTVGREKPSCSRLQTPGSQCVGGQRTKPAF